MFNSKKARGRAIPLLRGVQGCVLRLLTSFPVLWQAVGTQPEGFHVAIGFKRCVFEMYTINEFTIFRRPSTCAVICRPFRAWMLQIFLKALKALNASAQVEGLRVDDVKWI